jgi:hypothetical protein
MRLSFTLYIISPLPWDDVTQRDTITNGMERIEDASVHLQVRGCSSFYNLGVVKMVGPSIYGMHLGCHLIQPTLYPHVGHTIVFPSICPKMRQFGRVGGHQPRRLGNHPLPLIPSILLLCPGPRDVSKVSLVHLSTFASVGVHMNPCAFHLVPSHSLDQIDLKSTSMSERDWFGALRFP